MKTFLLLCAAVLATSAAASDLGKLQDSFMSRYDETNKERDEGLKKLESSYVAALERHLDKVKASGDLERVLPVRDEIQAVQTDARVLPELPTTADSELKGLRRKYVEARDSTATSHAKALVNLADKMQGALKEMESELTKAGNIDEALAAKRMRDTLASDAGIKRARLKLEGLSTDSVRSQKWIGLIETDIRLREGREPYAGPIGGENYGELHRAVRGAFEKRDPKGKELCVLMAPAEVEFCFDEPVSEFEGVAWIAKRGGVARLSFKVGGKEVFSKVVDAEDEEGEDTMKFNFEPTKRLIIETTESKPGGSWLALLGARAR